MSEKILIGFPGIFRGGEGIWFNRVALTLPLGDGIIVRWYNILLLITFVLCALFFAFRVKKAGLALGDCIDFAIVGLFGAILVGRLFFLLFNPQNHAFETFLDYLDITDGGFSLYGAFGGVALGVFLMAKIKKTCFDDCLKLCDSAVPVLLFGQTLVGVSTLFAGQIQGISVSDTYLLALCQKIGPGHQLLCYHPTFLYESFWCLLGLVLYYALKIGKRQKFFGETVLLYLGYYGMGRMVIEGFRNDRLFWGAFPISQVLAFLSFACVSVYLVLYHIKFHRKVLDKEEYVPLYEKSASRTYLPNASKRQAVEEASDAIDAIIANAEAKETENKFHHEEE